MRFCVLFFTMKHKKNSAASAVASALGKLAKGKPKNFKPGYLKTLSERLAAARAKRLEMIAQKNISKNS